MSPTASAYFRNVSTPATVALALGPAVELWWYNRPSLAQWRDDEHISEIFRKNYAMHYQMFSSDLRPAVKQDGAWWEKDPEYVRVETDEEYSEYQARIQGMLMETVLEVRPKVDAMKADLKSGAAGARPWRGRRTSRWGCQP